MSKSPASTSQPDTAPAVVVLCADQDVRDAVSGCYLSAGLRTFATLDGYEANVVLKTCPVRLLVIDRFPPPWPGLDALEKLRTAYPRLRIAFVARGDARDGAVLARASGTHVVPASPLDRRMLLWALDG